MTVVEADGHYVRPFVVRNLFIYSGETYSVLIKADQDPRRNYWATSHIVGRNASMTPSGKAIVTYAGNDPRRPPPTAPTAGPPWDNAAIRVKQSRAIVAHPGYIVPAPARADRTLLLLNTQNNIDGHIKWTINGVSLHFPATPYLVSMKRGLTDAYEQRPPLDMYDHIGHDISAPAPTNGTIGSPVYRLAFDSVVDVVLQNSNMLNNKSETHPWHLHGHDFWVLGHGDGKFDPAADSWRLLNVKDPIMKNTVPLHPDGWTAIRFHANNPGVWLFHCHVEAHVFMGMGVVFEEGVDKVSRLPSSIMGCGKSKGMH
jgi:L-ascorbate oxidase